MHKFACFMVKHLYLTNLFAFVSGEKIRGGSEGVLAVKKLSVSGQKKNLAHFFTCTTKAKQS